PPDTGSPDTSQPSDTTLPPDDTEMPDTQDPDDTDPGGDTTEPDIPDVPAEPMGSVVSVGSLEASGLHFLSLLGVAVDMTPDTLVVGAPGADIDGVDHAGAVYIYTRNADEQWVERQRLEPETPTEDGSLGQFLHIRDDRLVVAEPGLRQLHLYTPTGDGMWSRDQTLGHTPPPGLSGPLWGHRIALEGPWLAVTLLVSQEQYGEVVVYRLEPGEAVEVSRLSPEGPNTVGFGRGLDIKGDRLWVAAPEAPGGGAIYSYALTTGAGAVLDRVIEGFAGASTLGSDMDRGEAGFVYGDSMLDLGAGGLWWSPQSPSDTDTLVQLPLWDVDQGGGGVAGVDVEISPRFVATGALIDSTFVFQGGAGYVWRVMPDGPPVPFAKIFGEGRADVWCGYSIAAAGDWLALGCPFGGGELESGSVWLYRWSPEPPLSDLD
ncbi:MAG: hypothetical protein AAFS10_10705, partial [Myxococcota bacterium]